LRERWLALALILIVVAVILKQPPLLVLAVLFFVVSAVSRFWSRFSLWGVSYRRLLSSRRAFFGETVILELSITNRKFIPLPWIHVEEEIPEELLLLKGRSSSSYKPARRQLSSAFSVGWYSRLTRRYPLQCLKRGCYGFGPATIESGDPFGFVRTSMTVEQQERLLVYPPILPLEELGIPSRHPFGNLRTRQHLFQDPVQTVTTRDYVAGDPFNRVHWPATARLQRLQSRVFEKTSSVDLALFLDTRTVGHSLHWGALVTSLLETAVIAAASIASDTIGKSSKVGFYANEYYQQSNRFMRLPPSDHPDQLREILEALAQIRGVASLAAAELLAREARGLAWETTVVLITAVPTDEAVASLGRLRRTGRRIALVLIGAAVAAPGLGGIPIYRVSEEVYTRKLAAVSLEATL
jgi:uncharacterized protein (DUF58 family)